MAETRGVTCELIVPDPLLPSQLASETPQTGEKALLAALLADAVDCFLERTETGGSPKQLTTKRVLERQAAGRWFASDSDREITDFVRVCRVLDLDVAVVRRRLAEERFEQVWAWGRRQRSRRQRASTRQLSLVRTTTTGHGES